MLGNKKNTKWSGLTREKYTKEQKGKDQRIEFLGGKGEEEGMKDFPQILLHWSRIT